MFNKVSTTVEVNRNCMKYVCPMLHDLYQNGKLLPKGKYSDIITLPCTYTCMYDYNSRIDLYACVDIV